MLENFRFFPPAASTGAGSVDRLMLFLLAITVFFTTLIFVAIVYFSLRYRRRPGPPPPPIHGGLALEIAWSVIPLIIVMVIFGWGARVYVRAFTPPPDAMEIYVIGKQWMWKIQHPEGAREINALHVPAGRPIKLVLSSQDVIHDFFVPAFRMKHDVLPGRVVSEWFQATTPGVYHLFCSQYCGDQHSRMVGEIYVMQPKDYEAWLSGTIADVPPVQMGAALFHQYACDTCHGQRAPSLGGLYGTKADLEGGETVTADENYLRESILDSTAKIVKGYPPIMPSYRGQLSEEQLNDLVQYIKSLKNTQDVSNLKP